MYFSLQGFQHPTQIASLSLAEMLFVQMTEELNSLCLC